MNIIKLKSLLCVVMLLCGTVVIAQPQRQHGAPQRGGFKSVDPAEMAEKRTEMLAKQLGLSDAQKKKLLALNEKVVADMKVEAEARKAEQENKVAERKEKVELRRDLNLQIISILNDEQKVEYAKIQSKVQRGQSEQRGQRGQLQRGQRGQSGQMQRGQQGQRPQMGQRRPQGEQGRPQNGSQGAEPKSIDPIEMAEKRTDVMSDKLTLSDSQKKQILDLNVKIATSMSEEMEVRKLEKQAREQGREEMADKRSEYSVSVMALLNDEQKVEYMKILSRSGAPKQNNRGAKVCKAGKRGPQQGAARRPQQGKRPAHK